MLQIVLIPGKKKRKKEKGQPTTASWAQPFISQQINMASADCLHMAPCRRASPHFLISQQRINVLLTENIVLHRSSTSFTTCGLDSDTPTLTSALCRTSCYHRSSMSTQCVCNTEHFFGQTTAEQWYSMYKKDHSSQRSQPTAMFPGTWLK